MKKLTDILAILCLIAAIITGFILHKEVNHLYIYNDAATWTIHEIAGLSLTVLVALHCTEHKSWFRNYRKIPAKKITVSTILLATGILILATGIALMAGSRSHFISILHYALGILFTLLAIFHVAKRWKMLKTMFK